MQTRSPFFDDLAQLLTGAAGAAKGVRDEVDVLVKAQVEKAANQLDLVPREEFEAVRAMAIQAADRVEKLEAEVAALKGKAAPKRTASKKTSAKKKTAKKTTARRKS